MARFQYIMPALFFDFLMTHFIGSLRKTSLPYGWLVKFLKSIHINDLQIMFIF